MYTTKITAFNLSVKLETNDPRVVSELNLFLDRYYTIQQKGFGKQEDTVRVYVSKIKDYNCWFLANSQFSHFFHYLKDKGINLTVHETEDLRQYNDVTANFEVKEGWVLRDEQEPVYEFLIKNPVKSKMIPLVTGSGKTAVSLIAIGTLNKRLGIVIQPTYLEKWVSDVTTIHEATTEDVISIQGSKALRNIIALAKEGNLNHNYIIFSSRTLQDYISMYEETPEDCVEMYGCSPIELFPLLGIGIMLIDETHQQFHLIYKITLHTNVKYQIGLSATLMTEDSVVARAHKIIYPSSCVYEDNLLKRYMDMYPIAYTIPPHVMRHIRTTNYNSNVYSHIAFEKSILKRPHLLRDYFKIIANVIDEYYVEDYMSDDKAIIFVSTVKMATKLTNYLAERYPDKKALRYCEDDDYDEMLTGEIIVSTVISAGTGIDIPHLRVALQTVSISSPVSNIQSAGRLRYLKDRDVKFCYIYCNDIPKHRIYHNKKVELFSGRAANISYRKSRYGFS